MQSSLPAQSARRPIRAFASMASHPAIMIVGLIAQASGEQATSTVSVSRTIAILDGD